MTVAAVALLIALSGTAVAGAVAIVPLAKRALTADKAKVATLAINSQKVGGQTPDAIVAAAAAAPGPASSAAGLVVTKTASYSLNTQSEQLITASCDSGSKAVGGGFSDSTAALVLSAGSFPTADDSGWTEDLINLSSSTNGGGSVIVACVK
jgi:hypothetical protein